MKGAWSYALGTVLALAVPVAAHGQALDMHGRGVHVYVALDELEYQPGGDERPVEVDALAWLGGDFQRLWAKAHGERGTRGGAGEVEGQLLYGRVIAPYWDLQAGVAVDARFGEGDGRARGLLALGLQGLAPYWFEVESVLFLSQDGDVSARLQASYDLLFTQRLIVEPELQLDLAAQDVPRFGVQSGLSALEIGVRARYEIMREVAPYAGFVWVRRPRGADGLGAGEGASLVAGLRLWY